MGQQNFYDPRAEIEHQIAEGQVYEDARTGDELRIVYLADELVLLYDLGDADNGTWSSHRSERRKVFEKEVGAGRFKLLENEGVATSSGKLKKLSNLIERYEDEDGRKAKHKLQALEEAMEVLSEDKQADANEKVDFESIPGIGDRTASALRNSGYVVKADIRDASDDELKAVPGMGEKNLQNLRDEIE